MSHTIPKSKSTKRRRYLEEVETVDFIVENEKQIHFVQQTRTFQNNNDINLIVENQGISNISVHINNYDNYYLNNHSTNSFNFSSLTTDVIEGNADISDYDLNKFYSSESDDECISNINYIFDNNNNILKSFGRWTIENNITLSALSALLKI